MSETEPKTISETEPEPLKEMSETEPKPVSETEPEPLEDDTVKKNILEEHVYVKNAVPY